MKDGKAPVIDLNNPTFSEGVEEPIRHKPIADEAGTRHRSLGVSKGSSILAVPEGQIGEVQAKWIGVPSTERTDDTGSKAVAMANRVPLPSKELTFTRVDLDRDQDILLFLDLPTDTISVPRDSGLDPGWRVAQLSEGTSPQDTVVIFEKKELNEAGQAVIASKKIPLVKYHEFIRQMKRLEQENSRKPEQRGREEYMKRLFAPPDLTTAAQHKTDYSVLFGDEDLSDRSVEDAAARKPRGPELTEESQKDARLSIAEAIIADVAVQGILNQHGVLGIKDRDATEEQKLELIRKAIQTNPGLRLDLAHHYLSRFHNLQIDGSLPERVQRSGMQRDAVVRDQEKKLYLQVNGIDKASSEDYVVLMCLSMLDGTFRADKESDETYDWEAKKGTGQHREAARLVLFGRA